MDALLSEPHLEALNALDVLRGAVDALTVEDPFGRRSTLLEVYNDSLRSLEASIVNHANIELARTA